MAQKTPLPALTVMYADRWNGTWFIELEDFRDQLMTDYHLRFLITSFLRLKRQWLFFLSINKSGGFYFFQIATLNYLATSDVKAPLPQNTESKKKLLNLVTNLKKNQLLTNSGLNRIFALKIADIKKRIPYKKAIIWSNLKKKAVILFDNNINFGLLKNKNQRIKTWLLNYKPIIINYYYAPLTKFYYPTKNFLSVLNKNNDKKNIQIRNFSTITNNFKLNNNTNKYLYYNKNTNLVNNFMLNKPFKNFNKHLALYQIVSRIPSYYYRRIYLYKKYDTLKIGYQTLLKKYSHQLKVKHMERRFGTSLLFLSKAINRVIHMRFFLSYVPTQWYREDYQFLKRFVIFERYGAQKYFVSTMAVIHLAMSRGSATLLTDLLVRKLRKAHKHTSFLDCVEKICRYFMAGYESSNAYDYSLCKGIEILFKGKINGNDRSNVWRFKLGPVNTSTFYTNTREEHAKCMTRYGMFHIRVRLKLGKILTILLYVFKLFFYNWMFILASMECRYYWAIWISFR